MRFLFSVLALFSLPLVAFGAPQNFSELVGVVINFIALLVPVIIALTFVYILWGLTKAWIIDAGNEDSTKTGRMILFTGIIGLVVMVGIWGLVSLVRGAIFF